jgi:AcrR family transcriptional regulator
VDVTDPRAVRTRQRVLDATVRLLAEQGVQAANMEAIAAAAGTSRSTLYRHWPDRLPLLIDALEHLGSRFRQAPHEGPSSQEPLDVALQRIVGGIGDVAAVDFGQVGVVFRGGGEAAGDPAPVGGSQAVTDATDDPLQRDVERFL